MLTASTYKTDSKSLTTLFKKLKDIYKVEDISKNRQEYIINRVRKYGYLPCPHIKALEELSPAETIIGLEEKFKLNNIYINNEFNFRDDETSPVKRAGFSDSNWIKTEQHSIKLINLAGLGNGNETTAPGRFIHWLKQLLILPAGNLEKGVLSTTAYLIPFHPRDFGCAYLPTSSGVSENLQDELIVEKLNLDVKKQVQLFITLTQLAGHPVMYDVLPQTGRFSKIILSHPYAARWFDIKELINKLNCDLDQIVENLKDKYSFDDLNYIKNLVSKSLDGDYQDIPDNLKHIFDEINTELDSKRKLYSTEMTLKDNQEVLHKRVTKLINNLAGKSEHENISEEDIKNQGKIISELIQQGLWPAPGGAWCSAGIPVFDKMSQDAGFPLFKHYDYKGDDVTELANLDCQTPYYFVYLENGEFNEKVIDFFVDFLKKVQQEYNFDAFRVDHIDHIVDVFSEDQDHKPISYRAPKYILGKANSELKKSVPYFATLAEYMLWDGFLKEYHKDMNFDLLWGSDIVSQYQKNVSKILENNKEIEEYNSSFDSNESRLSILKTYNNQDGEFRAIDQYPGQLGESGALFKLLKFRFLPGGKLSQRPILYIDGDESFTKVGIEKVIGVEESMIRARNYEFFRKFDAISRFGLNNDIILYGKAEIYKSDDDKSGFVSWFIHREDESDYKERLLIVANENPPTELTKQDKEGGGSESIEKTHSAVCAKKIAIPDGFKIASEYILGENSFEFEEISEISNISDNNLIFKKLEPSEFHIYKIVSSN